MVCKCASAGQITLSKDSGQRWQQVPTLCTSACRRQALRFHMGLNSPKRCSNKQVTVPPHHLSSRDQHTQPGRYENKGKTPRHCNPRRSTGSPQRITGSSSRAVSSPLAHAARSCQRTRPGPCKLGCDTWAKGGTCARAWDPPALGQAFPAHAHACARRTC